MLDFISRIPYPENTVKPFLYPRYSLACEKPWYLKKCLFFRQPVSMGCYSRARGNLVEKKSFFTSHCLYWRIPCILLSILVLAGCVSIRVELKPENDQTTSFTHYSHYGLFGLIGKESLNIKEVCMEGQPAFVRSYFSFEDLLFAVTLLGLYVPKSLDIHCEQPLSLEEDLEV